MQLYVGTSEQFFEDTLQNQIAEKLKNAFENYFRYSPPPSEINSWKNSLKSISAVFQYSKLYDHGIILEYQLPLTSKRLDCMITGKNDDADHHAVIVELKQWDKVKDSDADDCVLTYVGGAERDILHPSRQVGNYQTYLADTHTAFDIATNPVLLSSCSYLHNYTTFEGDILFSDKFKDILIRYPVFTADDVRDLRDFLVTRLKKGGGDEVLNRVLHSKYRPSKKLLEHTGDIIKGKSEFILLDEQQIVYNKIFSCAKRGFHDRRKTAIIVKGGPGTGKSVIALNVMADLSLKGYNTHYATGSRAFTENLRKIVGNRASAQFKYFNSYTKADNNEIDVLILDEAHRIREFSHSRFTRQEHRTNKPQVQELLDVSKVAVFFIDDDQVVRPNEIGSSGLIREFAIKNNCEIFEFELEAQFRCNGSDAFVNWVNNTLGIKRTANVIWDMHDEFDFKIFDSPEDLEKAIIEKNNKSYSARLTAGFCWEWSRDINRDGTLKDDVVIGNFKRPWNARPEATRLHKDIPKSHYWATDPNGINQVGCIYTAQGFEFDYVGVIFGKDLYYNPAKAEWEVRSDYSKDSVVRTAKNMLDLVKNTYRVLLTRGMIGCYVYFMDEDTRNFFKSRIE